ncbi:hypothetical protein [Endozoicomonas sp. ALD040]|uniref:hypothetical protein n=1 Tax=unclassified Endozoicomonas TaxID=2644528 RepID=UPI003BAE8968
MLKTLTQMLCAWTILSCNALYANEELNKLYYRFSTQKMPELFDSIQSALNESPEISQRAKVKDLALVTKKAYKTWYKSLETLTPVEAGTAANLIRNNLSTVYFEQKVDEFLSSKSHMISWEIPVYHQIINIMIGVWGGVFFENENLAKIRKEIYHLFTCDDHDCSEIAEKFSSQHDEDVTLAIQRYFECKKTKGSAYGPHLAELCELINNDNFYKSTYFA